MQFSFVVPLVFILHGTITSTTPIPTARDTGIIHTGAVSDKALLSLRIRTNGGVEGARANEEHPVASGDVENEESREEIGGGGYDERMKAVTDALHVQFERELTQANERLRAATTELQEYRASGLSDSNKRAQLTLAKTEAQEAVDAAIKPITELNDQIERGHWGNRAQSSRAQTELLAGSI